MSAPGAHVLMPHEHVMGYWDRPDAADRARLLASFPLFASVGDRALRRLARQVTFAEFAPGEIVVAGGERGDSLLLILSGTAKVLGAPAARRLGRGDYFGELALAAGASRSATVIATDELHVIMLPRHSFLRLARRHSDISLTMLRDLSAQFRRVETLAGGA